ncbi:MAG TPA: alpha/beta hydrolase [Burkholderiales bacterium]|nr:alpha/beta hydrolase [Burkholderiales bacterium]
MIQSSFPSLNPHGFHRVAYTDWGNPANPHVVLCVHGLTRNGRDFDYLARTLQSDCRVVCMDVVGRGRSDWFQHKDDYTFRQYQHDAAALIARATDPHGRSVLPRWARSAPAGVDGKVDWIGTSMGGLIGMLIAAQPNSPIRRLVLNDIGPFIPWAALIRLKGYLGSQTRYASLEDVERGLREACAQWGPISDEQWRHLALHSVRKSENGSWEMACDPAVGVATAWGWNPDAKVGNRSLMGLEVWSVWEAIRCPTLILRGVDSEVLQRDTVERMCRSAAPVEVVELPGIGHAPSLMTQSQIETVRDFLLRGT